PTWGFRQPQAPGAEEVEFEANLAVIPEFLLLGIGEAAGPVFHGQGLHAIEFLLIEGESEEKATGFGVRVILVGANDAGTDGRGAVRGMRRLHGRSFWATASGGKHRSTGDGEATRFEAGTGCLGLRSWSIDGFVRKGRPAHHW